MSIQSDTARGVSSKLAPRRDGPYFIKEIKSPTTYIVEDSDHSIIGTYHVSMLRKFTGNDDETPIRPFGGRGSSNMREDEESSLIDMNNEIDRPENVPVITTRSNRAVKKPLRYR